MGLGENTDGMPNNNFGDKPESWIFGKLGLTAPTPKRDTAHEASRNPSIAVTNRVPKRGHAMDPIKKPPAPHRFFWSGSSVLWSNYFSRLHRRTPSLCQGQQREGCGRQGSEKVEYWEMQCGRGPVGEGKG